MSLQEIRKKIDIKDAAIVKLLNDRMELALMSKKFKKDVEDSKREDELLQKIRENSGGLINSQFIEKLFLEIITESKKLQKTDYSLIGFQGEHGAYGEVAARAWNDKYIPIPCMEFADVFEGVDKGQIDYGIIPIENTLGGVVGEANDILINSSLNVIGAVELPVHHCLLALPGIDHRDIRQVYSHTQALAQCRHFLARNNLEPVPYYDTAGSAKMIAEKRLETGACIASRLAGELYGLEVIKEGIEDLSTNKTRFLVLSKEKNPETGTKCSILFSTAHKAGTLFRTLQIFAEENINLSRIESIPSQPGTYAFFLDFIGSDKDERIIKILEKVKNETSDFKIMGCYNERVVK
ncbi:MAG: bifunctional chorismate mutase/prephenate dehydratase [Spirochaetes bacterium]|nr:bifunctional chorismate mutase/prephenate dehydratase [Spirochaetota bacterium]